MKVQIVALYIVQDQSSAAVAYFAPGGIQKMFYVLKGASDKKSRTGSSMAMGQTLLRVIKGKGSVMQKMVHVKIGPGDHLCRQK